MRTRSLFVCPSSRRSGCHPFSFHCFAHPRHLHSFPTRRSSDLSTATTRRWSSRGTARQASSSQTAASSDRKSTRLNSSHTVNSYAVFCLKKKKGLALPSRKAYLSADDRKIALTLHRLLRERPTN